VGGLSTKLATTLRLALGICGKAELSKTHDAKLSASNAEFRQVHAGREIVGDINIIKDELETHLTNNSAMF